MRRLSRSGLRLRALERALALIVVAGLAPGASTALAGAGDLVVVDPPAPVLPDDSAKPLDAALSGNGRFVAGVEEREGCVSLAPSWDYSNECYPEQKIWRYDLQTGARVKVDKGAFALGGARDPALSHDGAVAAWTTFFYYPDGDTNHVFRSRPGTGASGQDMIPYAGNQGPDGKWYPEFIRNPSISGDGLVVGLNGGFYGGGCASPGYLWKTTDLLPATTPTVRQLTSGCDAYDQSEWPGPGPAGMVHDSTAYHALSGDGKVMAFASGRKIYRHDVVAGTYAEIPVPTFPLATEPWSYGLFSLALSADGTTIAYTTGAGVDGQYSVGTTLWVANAITGAGTQVATIPTGQPSRKRPALSANGRYVAFDWPRHPATGADAGTERTYRLDRTNSTFKRVSQTAGGAPVTTWEFGRGPGISADGRYVTFIAVNAKQAVPDDATPTGAHVIRADVDGPTGDTTAPAKPASIKVSQSGGGVTLTWPASSDPSGPVLYKIRQRPVAGATQSLVGTKIQTATSVTFKGLVAGKPYRFAVTAEDAQGNRSTGTTVTFTAAGTADPTPPAITAPTKPYVGTSEQNVIGTFTITGSDLGNVTAVLIGNQVATGLVVTGTKITGKAPKAPDSASAPVTVLGPFGAKAAGRFYYRPPGTTETGD